MNKTYNFKARLWLYHGKAAWHFVTLPKNVFSEIDFYFAHVKRGWGSLPVNVTVGETTWKTSIFPDKKSESYILPVKKQVRKDESLVLKKNVNFKIKLTD